YHCLVGREFSLQHGRLHVRAAALEPAQARLSAKNNDAFPGKIGPSRIRAIWSQASQNLPRSLRGFTGLLACANKSLRSVRFQNRAHRFKLPSGVGWKLPAAARVQRVALAEAREDQSAL